MWRTSCSVDERDTARVPTFFRGRAARGGRATDTFFFFVAAAFPVMPKKTRKAKPPPPLCPVGCGNASVVLLGGGTKPKYRYLCTLCRTTFQQLKPTLACPDTSHSLTLSAGRRYRCGVCGAVKVGHVCRVESDDDAASLPPLSALACRETTSATRDAELPLPQSSD